jgi:hypothetical protein
VVQSIYNALLYFQANKSELFSQANAIQTPLIHQQQQADAVPSNIDDLSIANQGSQP